tara:strand:- start:111 stop:1007 length:897 start_codon:yes stop_codon:yes gene_type:complete
MKNIFITGGLGQDGQILTKILLSKKKYQVFVFGKKKNFSIKKRINFVKSNLLNKKKLENIFKKNPPNIIVHLAANNPAYEEISYKKFYKENILGSKNLFFSSYKYNPKLKFIFATSSQIFKKKKGTVTENSEKKIVKDYTKFYVKFRIEFDKFMLRQSINYSCLIFFNHDSIYRSKKFLFPRLIEAIKKRKKKFLNKILNYNIHGDFSHADDICNAIYKVILTKKRIKRLILSSNRCTSINDIIKHIIQKNKINLKLNFKTKNKKKCLKGNNRLAKKILKWKPKKSSFIAANEIYKSL